AARSCPPDGRPSLPVRPARPPTGVAGDGTGGVAERRPPAPRALPLRTAPIAAARGSRPLSPRRSLVLPSASRMRRSEDFAAAIRRGRRAGRPSLVVHLNIRTNADGDGQAPPLVGFVVSKAVGSAVTRNRVKRRLRHLMRDRLH